MPEANTSRRKFLNYILSGGILATLGSIFYPVYRFLVPPPSAEPNVNQLKLPFTRADIEAEPHRFKIFKFGRTPGIVFITDDGDLRALSATCTHLDCIVQYRPDWGIIWCACHNGRYDLNGKNISGPPPRPLDEYALNVVGEDIFVSRENA
jgi:Rieske Fe-S protein